VQFWSSLNSLYCNVWLVAMVTPTSNFAQCPCSIPQTLYCNNRSLSHYIIRFFHYVTRSILVLNGLKSRLLICSSLLLTTNISGIFSIQFSSGASTKQKQYRHCFLWVYDQDKPFGGGGEENAPCLYPVLY